MSKITDFNKYQLTMLISLHLPKTAGSSFLNSLEDHYRKDIQKDYNDLPLHCPPLQRHIHAIKEGIKNKSREYKNIKCIHGHFLPLKYRFYNNNQKRYFITWMREPSERIASQYFYMKRNYNPEKAKNQSLLKKMIEEDWSLERFCLGPELKNTYSQFLWGFPISKFNFIGITEDYENDLAYFSKVFFEKRLKEYRKNGNPTISTEKESYYANSNLKKKVQQHHAKDMELYLKALEIKDRRDN